MTEERSKGLPKTLFIMLLVLKLAIQQANKEESTFITEI